jgi:hypothetical protein
LTTAPTCLAWANPAILTISRLILSLPNLPMSGRVALALTVTSEVLIAAAT